MFNITADKYEQAHKELEEKEVMPNNNLTEIVVVLDRSGSMADVWEATISRLNEFFDVQKKAQGVGEVKVTMVVFDDKYDIIFNGTPLQLLPKFSETEFPPRGYTALHYAMGRTIDEVGMRLSSTAEDQRPGLVHFITMTDGGENASQDLTPKYDARKVKEMVEHQTQKYSWKFDFLGANQDAVLTAKGLGISIGNALSYASNEVGTKGAFDAIAAKTTGYRYSNTRGLAATACMDFSAEDRTTQLSAGAAPDVATANLTNTTNAANLTNSSTPKK